MGLLLVDFSETGERQSAGEKEGEKTCLSSPKEDP
jgi:hypothetical protein